MFIRNIKNSTLINTENVTQIYPSINNECGTFKLYFVFDAMNAEEMNEAVWEFESKDELECTLSAIGFTEI